jgi:hypothetical protein
MAACCKKLRKQSPKNVVEFFVVKDKNTVKDDYTLSYKF